VKVGIKTQGAFKCVICAFFFYQKFKPEI